jgi:hypothetical protein
MNLRVIMYKPRNFTIQNKTPDQSEITQKHLPKAYLYRFTIPIIQQL